MVSGKDANNSIKKIKKVVRVYLHLTSTLPWNTQISGNKTIGVNALGIKLQENVSVLILVKVKKHIQFKHHIK